MYTLIKISWRNVWRNKKRSIIIIIAIALGLIGGNFISSVYIGLMNQTIEESIEKQLSHIQIHHPSFLEDKELRHHIPDARGLIRELSGGKQVQSLSARTNLEGMVASPHLSSGVIITGVSPSMERQTTGIHEQITEGTFFGQEESRLPPVVIGKELANKLQSQTGSRIVLTCHDVNGELISSTYRVEGIFQSLSADHELHTLFVRTHDLRHLTNNEDLVTEIAISLKNPERHHLVAQELKDQHPGLMIRTWDEIAPDLLFIMDYTQLSMLWIMVVIMLGVSFGILNTILMSVLERVRELGMLMSIGMSKARIFAMIVLETVFLSLSGGLTGMALAALLISYVNHTGLDLSAIGGEGLRDFGFSPLVYPEINAGFYFQVTIIIVAFAILASLYPAARATRLSPAQAVRQE